MNNLAKVELIVETVVDPFTADPWGCGTITLEMIDKAEWVTEPWNPDADDQIWTAKQHAGRIKYLADNGWDTPIIMDVGVPALGYGWRKVEDGHHRLAAAIYRKDSHILASISGDTKEIEALCV